jgi:hypothetical protein
VSDVIGLAAMASDRQQNRTAIIIGKNAGRA